MAYHCAIAVKAGQLLVALGKVAQGCRSYVAIRGGLDLPLYLGSRATFALGQFRGHAVVAPCGLAMHCRWPHR